MRLEKYALIAIIFFLAGIFALYTGLNRASFRQMPEMDHPMHSQLSPAGAAAVYAADTAMKVAAKGEETHGIC